MYFQMKKIGAIPSFRPAVVLVAEGALVVRVDEDVESNNFRLKKTRIKGGSD